MTGKRCTEQYVEHDFEAVVIEARSLFAGRAQAAVIYCRRCGKNGVVGAFGQEVEFEPWAKERE